MHRTATTIVSHEHPSTKTRRPRHRGIAKLMHLVVLGLVLLSFHPLAHSQVFPCSGPGPGVVVVGEQPASNGVAAIPLCRAAPESSDQPTRRLGEGVRYRTTWGALASSTHPNLADRKVARSGDKNTREEAVNEALANCQAGSNGVPCKIEAVYHNGCVGLAVSTTDMYVVTKETTRMPIILGGDPVLELVPEVKQEALDACERAGGKQCTARTACASPATR